MNPMLIPAIISAIGAITSTIKTSKGKTNYPEFDANVLAAELAKIDALFGEQKTALQGQAAERLGEMKTASASDLAGRGIYGSPVSAYTDIANRKTVENALSQVLGQLAGQQASTKAGLLSDWAKLGYSSKLAQAQEDYKRRITSGNMLSALLSSISTGLFSTSESDPGTVPVPKSTT
jgi:hypothetical protein